MLEAINLSKTYNGQPAVDALDLHITGGEIYCLLGANGAGKTTTINLFLNLTQPSGGEARIDGMSVVDNPLETKKKLAYIPENLSLYPTLSGIENLQYFSGLSGIKLSVGKAGDLLVQAGLQTEAVGNRVSGYSKGMRQKVGIALAIARDSAVLLLDEPTSGLDPSASNDFAGLLGKMKLRGAAILMTTHDLFRAKETGTRIGIMSKGRLVEELKASEVSHSDLERVYLHHMRA
ncbi:MAG: ABC transporter ATP-binding protein [Balneolaceae bacterium]|nr:MAG: ABC transporter ATP-binding protein [Balneolaceae bacterium]